MNILHLHEKISLDGGAEVYIDQLVRLSKKFGIDSHWISVQPKAGVGHIVQNARSNENLEIATLDQVSEYIQKLIADHNIQLIHIHGLSYPKLIARCLKWLPVVRSLHEPRTFCPGHGKFWRFSERVCNRPFGLHCMLHTYTEGCGNRHPQRMLEAYNNTDFEIKKASKQYKSIIAMSAYMKDEAIKAGMPSERLTLNPYFTQEVEEERLVSEPEKRLLYLGRLIQHKGPHLMLKAVMPLLKKYPEWSLDIVGDGINGDAYRKMVADSDLNDKIIFHGWKGRDEVYEMIRQSYLVIFPSIYPEAFGIVGIEAMMYAKPVVAFDVGGVCTWLADGETGFAVPHKDSEAMSLKIEKLLQDEALYKQMSQKAREQGIERFTPETHVSKMIEIYKAAIQEPLPQAV